MPLNFFKGKKNCKDLGVGKNLTEFAKIPMPETLKIFIIFFKQKKNARVFREF